MGYFQQMTAIGKNTVGVKMEAASKPPSPALKGKGNQQVSNTVSVRKHIITGYDYMQVFLLRALGVGVQTQI